ncbi:MAG: amidohydrolase family protein [Deltaproteobacteria bacterium]|nr:amidohydrolase family protein [Deltaproteobacteria bacterium]
MTYAVDLHAHLFVPEAESLARKHPGWIRADEIGRRVMGDRSYLHNQEQAAKILSKSTNIDLRLEDMDHMGVDIQVLSPSPTQYYLWAEPELASSLVRIQNDRIAELCQTCPDRFLGIGAVALQHPELALSQLQECMNTYPMKGVEIASAYGGTDLSQVIQ